MIHNQINSIDIEYDVDNNNINLSIENSDGDITEITRSPTKNGVFSFQYKHPETNKKENYKGFIYGKEISIFPLYGIAYLSNKPIKYKMI